MTATPTVTSDEARLATYRDARRRGVAWLLGQLDDDGALGDPAEGFHTYRAPWTFTVCGETEAALAHCGWIRRNLLTPQGTIDGPFRVHDDAYAYRNATLIVGAQLAGQYDLGHGLLPDLLAWRDPASGGFPNDRLPGGGQSDNMDIPYTCGPGFACLATGHLAEAREVYRFLRRLWDAQTALPDRLYYAWSRSQQRPITEYDEARALWYVVENGAARAQRWTVGGIAAGFLCRLYLAEPRPEYLTLAREYQAFSMAATERQFDYPQACKSSWGSSLLYQLTGEAAYREWTYRLGDWYAARQETDGSWRWWQGGRTTLGARIELTLEFVMHLDTLIGALAARDGAGRGGAHGA